MTEFKPFELSPNDLRSITIANSDKVEGRRKAEEEKDAEYTNYRQMMFRCVLNALPKHMEDAAKNGYDHVIVIGWDINGREKMHLVAKNIETVLIAMGFKTFCKPYPAIKHMNALYVSWGNHD
jgi:hypothetical protein